MAKIKEFTVDMIVYSETNQYTKEEISDMFVDWVESKGLMCGGAVSEVSPGEQRKHETK